MVRIHSVYTELVQNLNGAVLHGIPCKHNPYPYQFRKDSKRIQSLVNAALVFMRLNERVRFDC